jgi:hypothetical protein
MAGISSRFDLFLATTCISLLSVKAAGEALGLMVGASVYDMEKAMTIIMTVVSLIMMLLGEASLSKMSQTGCRGGNLFRHSNIPLTRLGKLSLTETFLRRKRWGSRRLVWWIQ